MKRDWLLWITFAAASVFIVVKLDNYLGREPNLMLNLIYLLATLLFVFFLGASPSCGSCRAKTLQSAAATHEVAAENMMNYELQ